LVEHYGLHRGHAARRSARPRKVFQPDAPVAPKEADDDDGYNRAGVAALGASSRRLPLNPLDALNPFGVAVPPYHALRTSRFLYVEYVHGRSQLYDTQHDPYELRDIVASASRSLLVTLHKQLGELERCRGEACRRVEDRPIAAQP
jgi:hypothetical protein